MITLITGLPGAGKTLYAIQYIRAWAEREKRQVYYSGIKDLKLPWFELPFEEWTKAPTGSIIVCDEVQRVMRPRMHGAEVPKFVAELETHRHRGVDIVFITQDPRLLDANARRLTGRHFHVMRKFGTHFATVHEWSGVKENADKSRADSIKHEWRYPKDVFDLYHSAEQHTFKRRIPVKVWVLLVLPFLIVGLFWYGLDRARPKSAATPAASGAPTASTPQGREAMTPAKYVDQFTPRVAGLAYTAPAYDEITKPVRAPYPAACVQMAERCRCYSQQGTALDVPKPLCESIVAGGFFVPWDEREPPEKRHAEADRLQSSSLYVADRGPGLVSLGGDPRGHILKDRR